MSDHILLAAVVVAGLAYEAVLALQTLAGRTRRHEDADNVLRTHVVLTTALALLISGESYYTAR